MIHALRRLRSEESGFTLLELVVASMVGTVVLLAAFQLLDSSVLLSGKVTDRVDRTQRARQAMETITSELRSQVCVRAGEPAIVDGQETSVTFYAFLGSGAYVPDMRQIYWDNGSNSIIERVWPGTGVAPDTTFPASPTSSRVLLTDVRPPPPGTPMFTYYGTGATEPFVAPLSSANAAATSKIGIQFVTYTAGRNTTGSSITMQNEVFARTADPNGLSTTDAPECA